MGSPRFVERPCSVDNLSCDFLHAPPLRPGIRTQRFERLVTVEAAPLHEDAYV